MATRQIKDAKDLSTNELIYFKGHAQATFMSDGKTVEEAIDSVSDAIDSVSDSINSIDTSNFPQYDNQQAITVQGINNGYGATYAIPGSAIADGGEYDDTFALKSEIPDTSIFVSKGTLALTVTEINDKKQDKFTINGRDIILDEDIEVAELDLGANGRYAIADGLVDAEDNYYSLPSNPDNYGDANILATKADVNAKQDKLVSGSNIITINNNSILGSGNFDLATSDQLRAKQDTLVSGTSIKTINSTSLLGSGNIAIKDTKNLTYILNNSTSGTVTLQPNACIYMPNVLTGKLAINACSTISSNNADLIESRICFRMPNNAALPVIQFNGVAIRWAGGNAPTFEPDFTYEVSLFYPSNAGSVGPMGVCVGFK